MFVRHCEIEPAHLPQGIERRLLCRGGRLMMTEVIIPKGIASAPHSHEHEQVSYIVSGSFEVTSGDETVLLSKGDSVYVPSGQVHYVKAVEDGSVILDVFTPQRDDFLK